MERMKEHSKWRSHLEYGLELSARRDCCIIYEFNCYFCPEYLRGMNPALLFGPSLIMLVNMGRHWLSEHFNLLGKHFLKRITSITSAIPPLL